MTVFEGVILRPVITEKSLIEAKSHRYTFLVDKSANKYMVKAAVQKLFEVTVKKVFINTYKKSKTSVSRSRRKTSTEVFKKARVVIGADQKIAIFEEAVKETK